MFDLLIYKTFIAYVKLYLFYSWTIVVHGTVTRIKTGRGCGCPLIAITFFLHLKTTLNHKTIATCLQTITVWLKLFAITPRQVGESSQSTRVSLQPVYN